MRFIPGKSLRQVSALLCAVCAVQFLSPPAVWAWKPITHVYLSSEVVQDAAGDGKVTIYYANYEKGEIIGKLGDYAVDPLVLELIRDYQSTFYSGNFGPDAYPDPITGGMIVHADKGVVNTNDWLEYLWKEGYASGESKHVQAFVLGFMCHALGDMFIHSFLNYFAGGDFVLGDNAARHILFEGYIAKRQKGPKTYTVELPELVRHFIYKKMIDARPGSYLDTKLLQFSGGGKLSPPRVFSSLRNYLNEPSAEVNFAKPTQVAAFVYKQRWVQDIDRGLEALVDLTQDFAVTVFLDYQLPPSARVRRDREQKEPSWFDQLVLGQKDKPPGKAHRGYDLVTDYISNYLVYMGPAPDVLVDLSGVFGQLMPAFVTKYMDMLTKGGLDALSILAWGMPFDEYSKYTKEPEKYFDLELNRPGGPNIRPKFSLIEMTLSYIEKKLLGVNVLTGFSWWSIIPESQYERFANPHAQPVSLKEANRTYLKIKEDGYSDMSLTWDWRTFPPAFNTVQMEKLMFLEKSELRRLLNDLARMIYKKKESGLEIRQDTMEQENIMLGFCKSIDASAMWKHGNYPMLFARDPNVWSMLFMKQAGEGKDAVKNPFVYTPPPPPGGTFTKVSLAPDYLKDYTGQLDAGSLKDFDVQEFRQWYWDSGQEKRKVKSGQNTSGRTMEYVKAKREADAFINPEGGGPDKKAEVAFKETLDLNEKQARKIKAGEDLAFDVEYVVWDSPEIIGDGITDDDEFKKEVRVRVEAFTDDKGAVSVPVEETLTFGLGAGPQAEKASLSFAAQYPTKDEETRGVGVRMYLNDHLYSQAWFKDVYTVEGPGTDFNGYGNLKVTVKYELKKPVKDGDDALRPKFKVTLKPLSGQKERMKNLHQAAKETADRAQREGYDIDAAPGLPAAEAQTPLEKTGRSDTFSFARIPLGEYRVVVEVVPEQPEEEPSGTPVTPAVIPETDEDLQIIPSAKRLRQFFDTPAYADEIPYSGPQRGEKVVTMFNEAPVDADSAVKRETGVLPNFEVEVEMGKIDPGDPDKNKKQASQWRVLLYVHDQDGRPVKGANISTSADQAEKSEVSDGQFIIGPINAKTTREVSINAVVWSKSIHSNEQTAKRGAATAVYNGTSQVNRTIVIKGLSQPKWTIRGQAVYEDRSPVRLQAGDTFTIEIRFEGEHKKQINGTHYSLGPIAVPGDSSYDDPSRDVNQRSLYAEVRRGGSKIAHAVGDVRRQGRTSTPYDIRFSNSFKLIIEGGDDDKPDWAKNTDTKNKPKPKPRPQVTPSWKPQGPPPRPGTGKCVFPGDLVPPRDIADVARALGDIGFAVAGSSGSGRSVSVSFADPQCLMQYGLRDKTGGPVRAALKPVDGKPKAEIHFNDVTVIDHCAVPDFVAIVANAGQGTQEMFDIKYKMCSSRVQEPPQPSPSPSPAGDGRDTLFGQTFDFELEESH